MCFLLYAFRIGVLLVVALIAPPSKADQKAYAVLQGLDKVTARVTTLDAPIGRSTRFGALEIIPRICDERPPEETPESAAFLDIWEVREGEPAASLFRGWMFASSPGLNAMEHPVYDVRVLDCADGPTKRNRPLIKKRLETSNDDK